MSESISTRLFRWYFNFFPAYRRTGACVTYIARDLKEIRIKLPLNWKTRNYVGTLFGGCIFGATDPIYMMMFIKLLGPEYIVWDKAATIQYKKPGRTTLQAHFVISDDELASIHRELAKSGKLERVYQVKLVDTQGEVCAIVDKTISIRKK